MKPARSILLIFLIALFSLPIFSSANGGDQRVVESKYLINLSRSPFTPKVGEKTAMLISFVDFQKNKLISEDVVVKIRIAKLGGVGSAKREFLFEKKDMLVRGGVLEFPYTFESAGLHEIFIDFTFSSSPQKVYESPDFLMDVQPTENVESSDKPLIVGAGLGIVIAFLAGLLVGRKIKIAS